MDAQAAETDPIISSFDVLLNPSLPHGRKLWVLQQPNRADMNQPPSTEMRLKSGTGMVELDVPMDYMVSYDRDKGMNYGRHLKNSLAVKAGGTHGLSGGFGVGAPPPQRKKRGEDRDDDLFLDWTEALRQDKVLRTQTLGGQLPDHKEVQYMIGVFQGKDLHLTPVSNLVHLRPQLHHVDAVAHQERLAATTAAKEAAGAAGTTVGAPSAKAIHMTIRQGGDNQVATTETMLDRLHAVQKEEWRRLKFTDENDESAWDVYQESLILGGKEAARRAAEKAADEAQKDDDEDMDGKGKETAQDEEAAATEVDISERVAKLSTTWGDDELLEAVSGIVKPRILSKEERKKLEEKEAAEAEQKAQAAADLDAKKTAAARRGRGGALARGRAAAARGRGGAARGGSSATNRMDLT